MDRILQMVPRTAGGRDGVGDYARTLALRLRETFDLETTFISGPGELGEQSFAALVLHYVNYGYQRRGVPLWLPAFVQTLRPRARKLITIFHELYATGNWRQSAYWLRPLQMRIARQIARLSQLCIVSSEVMAMQLRALAPNEPVVVQPVFSNFGEPILSAEQIAARDAGRWAIAGGTQVLLRSLRSFLAAETSLAPREVILIGGANAVPVRDLLVGRKDWRYFPEVEAIEASRLLGSCAFGWIDYFEQLNVPTAAILKSSVFAAYCAHGVIPVLPNDGSAIGMQGDKMAGPFSPNSFPDDSGRAEIARAIYDWYHRHAASDHLGRTIAEACRK